MSKKLSPDQKLFNYVVGHLRRQGKKAIKEGTTNDCMYRGKDNTRCAAGCLIPNKLYHPVMEQKKVMFLLDTFPNLNAYLNKRFGEFDVYLLSDLQRIHDSHLVQNWEKEFNRLAAERSLRVPKTAVTPPQ